MNKVGRYLILLAIVSLLAFMAVSCAPAGKVPIGAITDNPAKYRNTEVTILGNVIERLVHQNEVVIKVQDDSGTIAVHARGEAPAIGDEIVVNGIVKSMVKIGPYDFGTMIEAEGIRGLYPWEKLASKNEGG